MLVFMRALAAILAFFTLLAAGLAQTPDPQQLLVDGIQAQQRGDFRTAIRDYQEFLRLRPNSFQAEVNLGAALVHEGQYDAAIAVYQSALSHAPGNNHVLLDLALAYYKKGDFPRAKEHFAAINRAEPNNVQVATLLGDTENRLGEPAEAVGLLAPLESKYSENLDFEYALGSALIASGQRREGVVRIEKVAKEKNSAEAYLLAGSTLLKMNEFTRARDDLDIALRLNPKLSGIYSLAGTARDNIGDLKVGAPVTMAGVRIGRVNAVSFDSTTFKAHVTLGIERSYRQIPEDTFASIQTAGLLGAKYVGFSSPGGSNTYLSEGSQMQFTQSALVLEDLVNRLFASVAGKKDSNAK